MELGTEVESDPDTDALTAYHIVLASLKHPAVRQNERMHLLTRSQIEWVLSALEAHGEVRAQWESAHAWVEVRRQGGAVSLFFPIKQSRRDQQQQAVATTADDDEDDGFTRESIR
jgi:hypothetical protein